MFCLRICSLVAFLAAVSGCAMRNGARVPSPRAPSMETGLASWYGEPYHGRRSANGEIYDMEKLTAAHRTLPFDTAVDVTNLDNGRSVRVRIIDRGPFVEGRVIDLSRAAARELGMLGRGTARVRLEVAAPARGAREEQALFAVQLGAFADRERAEILRRSLAARYQHTWLVLRPGDPPLWRVLVGSAPSQADAQSLLRRLKQEQGSAFIVRLDPPTR